MKGSPYRTPVPPVEDGVHRPLFSVMIPTYHCARYLGDTLRSVLVQDPGPTDMEIVVVDDGSELDDPEAVVRTVGNGRVTFVRQTRNVGHIRNFQTCLERSRGRLIHLLHGDDQVEVGFYTRIRALFEQEPTIGAAFCRSVYIDAAGKETGMTSELQAVTGTLVDGLVRLAEEQHVMTPSIVVRREAYELLGGFDARLKCAEDWEMWVRIAAAYPVGYEPEALARYRMHDDSNTGRNVRSAGDVHYTREAIRLFSVYLPENVRRPVVQKALGTYARSTLDHAARLVANGDLAAAGAQAREAFRFSASLPTIGYALHRLLGVAVARFRPAPRTVHPDIGEPQRL